jgi:hypothetical protein
MPYARRSSRRSAPRRRANPMRKYYPDPDKPGNLALRTSYGGSMASAQKYGFDYRSANDTQKYARIQDRFRGRGKYWGERVGKFLGDRVGFGSVGREIGGWASDQLAKASKPKGRGLYTGRGQYNSLFANGEQSMAIATSGDETEDIVYSNREYVSDVYGPSDPDFSIQKFGLNPGLADVFPWLSQISQNYEEYELVQCIFEYKSVISETSSNTNGQTGTILMATNYNASQKAFGDKETMMQYHGGQSGKVTQDLFHGVECHPEKSVGDMDKFIRTGPTQDVADLKDFDHGNFFLALNNIPATYQDQQIGELWINYTVRLRKPRLFTSRCLNQKRDLFSTQASVINENSANGTGLRNNWTKSKSNNVGCTLVNRGSAGGGTPSSRARIGLLFPASFNGAVEVILTIVLQGETIMNVANDVLNTCTPVIVGGANIEELNDIVGVGEFDSDNPARWFYAIAGTDNNEDTSNSRTGGMYSQVAHVQVRASTNGDENLIEFTIPDSNVLFDATATFNSVSIDVRQITTAHNTSYDSKPEYEKFTYAISSTL